MNRLFLLSMMAFLSACSTLPSSEEMQKQTKNYQLPLKEEKGLARVFVVRPSSIGALIKFNIHLDSKDEAAEMGYTKGNQHIYFYLSPGKHTLYSDAENWAELTVNAKANEEIYLLQEPEMGWWMARNNVYIIDELRGKYLLMTTSLGEIKKFKK